MSCFFFFFFFFQAEDGIRDLYVTGVQTCALPICALLDHGFAAETPVTAPAAAAAAENHQAVLRGVDLGGLELFFVALEFGQVQVERLLLRLDVGPVLGEFALALEL